MAPRNRFQVLVNPRRPALALAVMASAVLLAGCNGDSQVEITLNNAASAILGTRPNPNKELTLAQGKKLIAEIRKDPKRVEKLTIQERRFLAKAMNAGDEQAIEVP